MRTLVDLGPFTGVVTSLDPEQIPPNAAADMLNVRVENGVIKRRYGTRLWGAAAGDWGSQGNIYGADYVQGYTAAYALVEEYLTFENHSNSTPTGNILPFRINTSGSRAALGSSPAVIPQPTYGNQPGVRSFAFGGVSYSISPADGLFKHTIGTDASWTKLTPPKAPTLPLKAQIYVTANDDNSGGIMNWSGAGTSHTMKWSGIVPASNITVTQQNTNTGASVISGGASDGTLQMGIDTTKWSTPLPNVGPSSYFEADLTATTDFGGVAKDWSAYNSIAFRIENAAFPDSFGIALDPAQSGLPGGKPIITVLVESVAHGNVSPSSVTFYQVGAAAVYSVVSIIQTGTPIGYQGLDVVCNFSSLPVDVNKIKITVQWVEGATGTGLISVAKAAFNVSPLALGSQGNFAGLTIVGAGLAAAAQAVQNGSIELIHDKSGSGASALSESVTVTLDATGGPGQQDWTYVDRVFIPISASTVSMDATQFQVTAINASGISFPATAIQVLGVGGVSDKGSGTHVILMADWQPKLGRVDFATIQKIKIEWVVFGGSGSNGQPIAISPVTLGNVQTQGLDDSGTAVNLQLAYTYYSSSSGLESPVAGTISITPAMGVGGQVTDPATGTRYPRWSRPKLYFTKNTGTGYDGLYDNYRLYGKRPTDSAWALIATVALAATGSGGSGKTFGGVTYDASYSLRSTWAEDQGGGLFNPGGAQWGNAVCGAAFQGWVVWGFKGGYQNVQHSRIGFPETVYANSDLTQLSPDFTDRPATFTLADNQADDPVAMFGCGANLVILGSNGVYAQSGQSPSSMTPPMRIPKALGAWGQYSCCKWHTDQGLATVVYASRYLEGIWMIVPTYTYFGTIFEVTELTKDIRGLMKTFLYDGGGFSDWKDLRLAVDEELDSLWVMMGNRAMVLRRPSLVDGQRHWELYAYSVGGGVFKFLSMTPVRRSKVFDSNGKVYDLEWSSTANAYVDQASGDALDASGANGVPISSLFWTSKKYAEDQVTRVSHARIDRDGIASESGNAPSLRCISTRQTATIACTDTKWNVRFGALQQGHEHQYTLYLTDGAIGGVKRASIEHLGPLGRRYNE